MNTKTITKRLIFVLLIFWSCPAVFGYDPAIADSNEKAVDVPEVDPFAEALADPDPFNFAPLVFPKIEAIDVGVGDTLGSIVEKVSAALPDESRKYFRFDLSIEEMAMPVTGPLRVRNLSVGELFTYLAQISGLRAEYRFGLWRVTFAPKDAIVSHYYRLTREEIEALGWVIEGEVVSRKDGRLWSDTSGSRATVVKVNKVNDPSGLVTMEMRDSIEAHRIFEARILLLRLGEDP